jgi:hypothetical protein
MSDSKSDLRPFSDLEKPHAVAADSVGDAVTGPLAVRLGDLWSEFIRVADEARDPAALPKRAAVVPLLDDMKGILQWD